VVAVWPGVAPGVVVHAATPARSRPASANRGVLISISNRWVRSPSRGSSPGRPANRRNGDGYPDVTRVGTSRQNLPGTADRQTMSTLDLRSRLVGAGVSGGHACKTAAPGGWISDSQLRTTDPVGHCSVTSSRGCGPGRTSRFTSSAESLARTPVRSGCSPANDTSGSVGMAPVVGWAVVPQSMRNGTIPSTGSPAPCVSRHVRSAPCEVRREIVRGGPGSYPRACAAAMAASRSRGRTHQVATREAVKSSMPNGRGRGCWSASSLATTVHLRTVVR
jgi:hypothetical protein